MSITFVEKHPPIHQLDENYIPTFKRVFQAICTEKYGPQKVRQELNSVLGLTLNTTYSYGSGSTLETNTTVVKNISVDLDTTAQDWKQWIVTLDYGPWNPLTHAENPLDIPAAVNFSGETFLVPLTKDALTGDPVVNTAYDYFDPGPEREFSRTILKVGLNIDYASLNPVTVMGFADKVNDATWYGFAAKTWKCSAPTISREYHPVCGNFWRVEFTFSHNVLTWKKFLLNQGYREYVSGNSGFLKKQNIFINEQPATKPVFLNSSGGKLTPPVDSSNIIVLNFDAYETMDFSSAFSSFPSDLFG